MKYLIIFILSLTSTLLNGQNRENYSIDNTDIISLRSKVDSINSADNLDSVEMIFLSKKQAICDVVFYRGDSIKDVENDIKMGIDIPQLLMKYPNCHVATNQLATLEHGSKPETTEYFNVSIVPIELFASSIYLDTTQFNAGIKNSTNNLIPGIKFPTSIKNSFSAIHFKSYHHSDLLPNRYQEYILYHSKLLNHFSDYFNHTNASNISFDQFLLLFNKTEGVLMLKAMNVDIFKYYIGNYLKHDNKDESNYLTLLPINLHEILNSYDSEESLNLILSMAEDERLDLLNRYRLLILALKTNDLSESKTIFDMNSERINQTIDKFPETLHSKLKNRNGK